jgi:hypothetical protein
MSENERKEFVEILKKYNQRLSHNKKASRDILVDAGIFTKKGNLKENYKHLCIPQDQD